MSGRLYLLERYPGRRSFLSNGSEALHFSESISNQRYPSRDSQRDRLSDKPIAALNTSTCMIRNAVLKNQAIPQLGGGLTITSCARGTIPFYFVLGYALYRRH